MFCQVVFLNKWLDCPQEKLEEHRRMQELLQEKWAKFNNDTRHFSPYQRWLALQNHRNMLRKRMTLIHSPAVDVPSEECDRAASCGS